MAGAVNGMNFTWCGQSCGSTSRLFLHESIHDRVLDGMMQTIQSYKPASDRDGHQHGRHHLQAQHDKILGYIDIGRKEGAKLAFGGKAPNDRC